MAKQVGATLTQVRLDNGGQGRISSRSELRQRSCPKGENRLWAIRINRTEFIDMTVCQLAQNNAYIG